MLKHDSYIMGQTNVRLSITHMNRKNSISSSFYKDERPDTKRTYHISEQHLLEVLPLLQQAQTKYLTSNNSTNNIHVAIAIYRTLYFFARVWSMKGKEKHLKQPQLIALLINDRFFDNTLHVIQAHPRSTILHNCAKELIIECLREETLPPAYFYLPDSGYL